MHARKTKTPDSRYYQLKLCKYFIMKRRVLVQKKQAKTGQVLQKTFQKIIYELYDRPKRDLLFSLPKVT